MNKTRSITRRAIISATSAISACGAFGLSACAAAGEKLRAASERYRLGFKVLRQVGGADFDRPINAMAEVSPDFARFVVEYGYGDVLSRPTLDLTTREAITVASLMVQGNQALPTRYHVNGFLNVGGKAEQLVELCFLSIGMCGFPATIETIGGIRTALEERGETLAPVPITESDGTARRLEGLRHLAFHGADGAARLRDLTNTTPAYAQLLIEFVHGELLTRDGLDAKMKYLSIITMLATIGNNDAWLRDFTVSALRAGVTREEIIETMIQLCVYAGFPSAVVGFFTVVDVFRGLDENKIAFADGAIPEDAPSFAREASEAYASRLERGRAALSQIAGARGAAVLAGFDDIAPEIGRMIVAHSYGDIFSRPNLDPALRELTTISCMAAIGSRTAQTPLRVHLNAALKVGASRDQIVETLLNLIPYVGYPKVEGALETAHTVFSQWDAEQAEKG